MTPPRPRERGLTLPEILVTLTVALIGSIGALAVYRTSLRANAGTRDLDRARQLAEGLLEDVRGLDLPAVEALAASQLPDWRTPPPLEVVYHRDLDVEAIEGADLVRLTATVTYSDDGSGREASMHRVRLELVRTRQERF